MTVPAPPTVDTGGHLVPRTTPTRVISCKYTSHSGIEPSWALQPYEFTSGLDRMAQDLWWLPATAEDLPRACPTVARAQSVDYLIGLRYAGGGTVWVSTGDRWGCRNSTNGKVFSSRIVGDQLGSSLAAGRWVPSRSTTDRLDPNPCRTGPEPGRFGEDTTLVPPSPVELQVCENLGPPAVNQPAVYRTGTLRTGVAEFAAQLSSGRSESSVMGCHAPRGIHHDYTLTFRYAEGPPVSVHALIPCEPPLLGETLKVQEAPGTDLAGRLAAVVAGG
jgi:hypothetical protein